MPSRAGIVVAQSLVCHGVRVHAGDLVFRGYRFLLTAAIAACLCTAAIQPCLLTAGPFVVDRGDPLGCVSSGCMEDALLYVLLQKMALIQQLTIQSNLWAPLPSPCKDWRTDESIPALALSKSVGNTTGIRL